MPTAKNFFQLEEPQLKVFSPRRGIKAGRERNRSVELEDFSKCQIRKNPHNCSLYYLSKT
jgi:hypothetical protein